MVRPGVVCFIFADPLVGLFTIYRLAETLRTGYVSPAVRQPFWGLRLSTPGARGAGTPVS